MRTLTTSVRLFFVLALSLFVVVACGGDSTTGPQQPEEDGPSTGSLSVQVSTQGDSIDPDGYALAVDGGSAQDIAVNDTLVIGSLSEGSHEVSVQKAASNCESPSTSGSVVAGDTTAVSLSVQCAASFRDKIVFYSERSGSPGVYTMNPDGSNPQELTGQDIAPWDITSDGTAVIGVSNTNDATGEWEIVRVDPDGAVTQLTSDTLADVYPRFTTDETGIVFTNESTNGVDRLYQMNRDGSGQQRIGSFPHEIHSVDAAPDEDRLVVALQDTSSSDLDLDLHAMDANGGNRTNIHDDTTLVAYPTYAPSGDRIAYDQSTRAQLRIMNPDGTGRTTLLTSSTNDLFLPRWVPSGNALLYQQDGDIYRINTDGSGKTNLTATSSSDLYAVMSAWTSGNN